MLDSGNHGIAHLFGPRNSCDCIVENCYFENIGNMRRPVLGKDGAAVAIGGSGTLIHGNTMRRCLRGVEVECGSFPDPKVPSTGVRIVNNLIDQVYWQGILCTPNNPDQYRLFHQIVISNNQIRGWGMKPDGADAWGGIWNHEGIYITGGIGYVITGNTITAMWDGNGMRLEAVHGPIEDSLIAGNSIIEVDRSGISLSGSPSFRCSRNYLTSNSILGAAGYPIWLDGKKNVVSNNLILESKKLGWVHEKNHFDNMMGQNFPLIT